MAKKQTDGSLALEQQRVIVIPAHDEIVARKLRVAAYARVSSSSEDQLNSYRVQNQYYSELISSNPDWEMVDIYADEGITGTSVEKREDFQRMMQDCRKGKIDRILVKSISRFARNTKDCLAAVRELKELGVSVQFEEQGIDTSKVSSEMVTAIMASLAQKGSESISGNVRWGVQNRMQDGTYMTASVPFGYELCDKKMKINQEEAQIVRQIFDLYLSGVSIEKIVLELNAGCHEISDKKIWCKTAVSYILGNERYIGDRLLQKFYMTDTLPRPGGGGSGPAAPGAARHRDRRRAGAAAPPRRGCAAGGRRRLRPPVRRPGLGPVLRFPRGGDACGGAGIRDGIRGGARPRFRACFCPGESRPCPAGIPGRPAACFP